MLFLLVFVGGRCTLFINVGVTFILTLGTLKFKNFPIKDYALPGTAFYHCQILIIVRDFPAHIAVVMKLLLRPQSVMVRPCPSRDVCGTGKKMLALIMFCICLLQSKYHISWAQEFLISCEFYIDWNMFGGVKQEKVFFKRFIAITKRMTDMVHPVNIHFSSHCHDVTYYFPSDYNVSFSLV